MEYQLILQDLYGFSDIPMSIYTKGKKVLSLCEEEFEKDFTFDLLKKFKSDKGNNNLLAIMDYVYCGMLSLDNEDTILVIGPVIPYECTSVQANLISGKLDMDASMTIELRAYLNRLPYYRLEQFKSLLRILDRILNENQDNETNIIFDHADLAETEFPLEREGYMKHFQNNLQRDLVNYIEFGKVTDLEIRIHDVFGGFKEIQHFPVFAKDQIFTAKMIFVNSLSIATNAASRGGVPQEASMNLNNFYFSQVDEINTITDFGKIFRRMFVDFAKLSAKYRRLKVSSGLVTKINREVQLSMYEKLSPTIISERLSLNVSYICREFKKHTGKTITHYINEMKMEEAKRLMSVTQQTVTEISNALGYSSSQYFHRIFKDVVGMTPNEYKKSRQ